jgi:hypothetical protein
MSGYAIYPDPEFLAAKAVAVKEQPRQAAFRQNRRILPHAAARRQHQSLLLERLSLDCRLLIWEHVLQAKHTRLERWRPPYSRVGTSTALDADCFPYRIITAGTEKVEKPLALLLCGRQL